MSFIQRRLLATLPNSKPLLLDILPSKKMISRLLFDFDAVHNFNRYLPVVESIYDEKPNIPDKFLGNDLLLFQRVLSEIRKQTHTINPLLMQLENDLIEVAAERGSRDAICILSFMALDDNGKEGWTEDDKITAKKYIKELMNLQHPLVFKLAADRELKSNNENENKTESNDTELKKDEEISISNITSSGDKLSRAVSLYNHFLTLDSKSTIAAAAHRSLGMIYFKLEELVKAKNHFEKSIELAPVTDNAQAHFFLGLLNEHDLFKSRYHFQMAATQGFRESFANLGYLELNVFHDLDKSREWFKLGAELGVQECIVGLFDIAIREKNFKNALKIYQKAQNQGLSDLFMSVRKETIENLLKNVDNSADKEKQETATTADTASSDNTNKSRWDI